MTLVVRLDTYDSVRKLLVRMRGSRSCACAVSASVRGLVVGTVRDYSAGGNHSGTTCAWSLYFFCANFDKKNSPFLVDMVAIVESWGIDDRLVKIFEGKQKNS